MSSDLPRITQRRIAYAFRIFCAIYGYDAVLEGTQTAATEHPRICYGFAPTRTQDVAIPALYVPRPASAAVNSPAQIPLKKAPVYTQLGLNSVPCFFTSGTSVDWLGEIFEWLSCADEYAVIQRDEVGRIPFAATVHGRFGLDPSVPYAGVAMFELNRRICDTLGGAWPKRATPPMGVEGVLIAPSHDLDFLPINAFSNAKRLVKNVAIAAIHFRDPRLAASIAASMLRGVATWKSPLDCIDELVIRERNANIRSTYNVLCYSAHARDGDYGLDNAKVKGILRLIADNHMEIALHGSYTSLENGRIGFELERLTAAGYRAIGLRQHWLRFAGDNLFEEIAKLGLSYDSTVGFEKHIGFRAGACFPYLPYDFRREQAYQFVEIPLVIMDGALYEQAKRTGSPALALCQRVFDMIESFGWGGVAILWHNTAFGGGQLPLEIGQLYWESKRPSQRWVSCREVAGVAAPLLCSSQDGASTC